MGNIRENTHLDREIVDLLALHKLPEPLLSGITKKVGTALAADGCWLLVDAAIASNCLIYSWCDRSQITLPLAEILAEYGGKDLRQPLLINNLVTQTERDSSVWALAIVPARFEGKTVGFLVLASLQANRWVESDLNLLHEISELIGIAIDKSLTYQKYLTLNHYQTILPELSTALSKRLDNEQFFKLALMSAAQALEVDLGLVLVLKYDEIRAVKTGNNPLSKVKVFLAEEWRRANDALKTPNSWEFGLEECIFLKETYQKAPEIWISQAEGNNVPDAKLTSLYPQFGNWLILPLMSLSKEANYGGIVLGFLVFQHAQIRNWQAEELALVSWIGVLISTAIVQSQTISQVQTLVEDRTAQLQSSLEVQAMLYDKTRQQLEQVRQAKKAREEFIDSISHELRTPLTAMNLAIRMLRQPGLSDDRRTNYFNILEQQCNQEIALVNDLLDWGRLESKQFEVQVQKVDLPQLIEPLAQSFGDRWLSKGLKLELEFPPHPIDLATDKDILRRILAELLTNAGKYSLAETTVRLQASLSTANREIILKVINIGNCIPSEEIAHIFEPLHRPAGTATRAVRGTGLGLALVKSFIRHLHGSISVSSDSAPDNKGCEICFTLTLPQTVDNI